jgi:ABC-type uncharacterized transport system ATPase subunit
LIQTRFIDGVFPARKASNLIGVYVYTGDIDTKLGEAGSGNKSDVTRADYGNVHS